MNSLIITSNFILIPSEPVASPYPFISCQKENVVRLSIIFFRARLRSNIIGFIKVRVESKSSVESIGRLRLTLNNQYIYFFPSFKARCRFLLTILHHLCSRQPATHLVHFIRSLFPSLNSHRSVARGEVTTFFCVSQLIKTKAADHLFVGFHVSCRRGNHGDSWVSTKNQANVIVGFIVLWLATMKRSSGLSLVSLFSGSFDVYDCCSNARCNKQTIGLDSFSVVFIVAYVNI